MTPMTILPGYGNPLPILGQVKHQNDVKNLNAEENTNPSTSGYNAEGENPKSLAIYNVAI